MRPEWAFLALVWLAGGVAALVCVCVGLFFWFVGSVRLLEGIEFEDAGDE